MDIPMLLRGIIMGFSIAAPVGPIGVLCIRRTLAEGRLIGLMSGLGAATADMSYGLVAAFGLTAVSSLLISQTVWLRVVGGLFLLYLGARTFLARPGDRPASAEGRGLAGAYASTLVLTLTNPPTILSFLAVFAGLGLGDTRGDYGAATQLVAGVFIGSALWWLLLSSGVDLFRSRFTPGRLAWVNRLAGLIILVFGVVTLGSLLVG
ncbi:MAG: LysE family transporter [Anaerolineae bacterium]|nr:LysE family transporter [Anaerolineae bacterium]